MYGFTDDKSKWRLGTWMWINISRQLFTPGIVSEDSEIAARFPDKFVFKMEITNGNLKQMCAEVKNPALVWDVIHDDLGTHRIYGLYELTEDEQEDAVLLENVFFQNNYLYFIAKAQPAGVINVRIKGE